MKHIVFIAALCSTIMVAPVLAADQAKSTINLSTDQQKLGYVFGYKVGKNFHDYQMVVDANSFKQGLDAGLAGTPAAMTPAQMQETIATFQKQMKEKQADLMKKTAAENEKKGKAFMKNFVAQKDVQQVDDNLAYKVITKGSGAKPTANDAVMITYEGKLITGQVFDSTKRNNDKPVTLQMSQVIPGMKALLMLMPVGSTWQAVIGPKAAYGEKGIPYHIGPNETLIFEVSLKSIVPSVGTAKLPAAATAGAKA